jgi:hypothetical protein
MLSGQTIYVLRPLQLAHLSPIGWEHVNLTGDYIWQVAGRFRKGSFRPLRPFAASNFLSDDF